MVRERFGEKKFSSIGMGYAKYCGYTEVIRNREQKD